MAKEWIEPITDRTYGDVQMVQSNPELENAKGAWNAEDLNRIEKNTAYCVEYMMEKKIYRSDPGLEIKDNDHWTGDMVPTYNDIRRIINNVRQITEYARENNANIQEELPVLYPSTHIDYVLANNIERALDVLHDQPDPPKDYFKLTVEEGIILRVVRYTGEIEEVNANEVLLAEDEVATIRGIPSEPDAQYKIFQFWSGNEDDLQYLDHWDRQETNYLGQYRNVKFKANFQTRIPRTLTLNSAYISVSGSDTAESGPSTGVYYAGDRVMIIANRALTGKMFYEWQGTKEAIDNIVGVTSTLDPSTAWLQMPDCDVELTPFYVSADGNKVTVTNGSGTGWYKYKEYVSISADVPAHYGFDNWSGDTKYLTDIHSSWQSFEMPDWPLSFTAHYSYRYSYNDVQIIDGLINYNGSNVSSVSGVKQTSSLTLVPTPPDSTQGLYYWEIEGLGSVGTDNVGNHTNTFTVGDGNAIITGHYSTLRNLTVTNVNNGGGTSSYSIAQGRKQRLTTTSSTGSYRFNGWYENGTRISTSTTLDVTMGEEDRNIEARYDYYATYTVTLVNRNNSGETTTSQVLSGNYWSSSTTEEVGDYLLVGWNKNGTQVSTSTSYGFYVSSDTTIEVVYRPKETYHLTVNNGSGSGDYKERQSVTITADDGEFSDWSTSNIYSIGSQYSKSTWVKLGRGDGTVTANYNLRQITVVTNSGTNTYSVREGAGLSINALPAPNTYEWDTSVGWTIDEGGTGSFANSSRSDTTFYAGSTDATIRANYKPIPYFTVTVINGYVGATEADLDKKLSTGTFLRDSSPYIRMLPAPDTKRFLQWQINQGEDSDVYQPLAETTYIRQLLHDIEVEALYYIPDPELKFTLTVRRYDGTISEGRYPVGYEQQVSAGYPPEGMKFYRWEEDYKYLAHGRYEADNLVRMPGQDVLLEEHFVPKDWTPTFHLHMTTMSECMYETTYTNPETGETEVREVWDTEHEYEEGTKVQIRTKNIPFTQEFVQWTVVDENGNSCVEYLAELKKEVTTVEMPDKDLYISPMIKEKQPYKMIIIDGRPSDQDYVAGARADVSFFKETEESKRGEVKFRFKRWISGPGTEIGVQDLVLYDTGKQFNVLTAGTLEEPQQISMPAKNVVIQATYDTLYHVDITNGTIDDLAEGEEPYYKVGTKINITANEPPVNKKFIRWEGTTEYIQNKWDPTTTITMGAHYVKLTAIYALTTDENDIGYSLVSLKDSATVNVRDITLVSGEVRLGCIITDNIGHNYIVRSVNEIEGTATITRMTKINKGGNVYE